MIQAPAPQHAGRQPGPLWKRVVAATLLVVSGAMLTGAGWLGLYPFYTNVRAGQKQARLLDELTRTQTTATPAAYKAGRIKEGAALTRLQIPRIGLDTVVVEGTNATALAAGAGHYRDTPLPGETGNMAVAGHRTMNGHPFNRLDELKTGDKVILITPFGRYTYEVVPPFDQHANPWVTTPNDWSVVSQTNQAMLTLTTCHPKGSAQRRLIARAKLVNSEPLS
jgi:sortase A